MITIEIDNLDECRREWHRAEMAIGDGTVRGVEFGVKEAAEEALRTRRWKNRTGNTERNTRGVVEIRVQGGAVGYFECAVAHASFLADGTVDHDIYPKAGFGTRASKRKPGQTNRKITDIGTHRVALRWYDAGGQVHFAAHVHVKGMQPDNFMANGYFKAERVIVREVEIGVSHAQQILDS